MSEQIFNATTGASIINQSAFAQSPAALGLDLSSEIIVCTPYNDIAEYLGTRAAILAEGIIPTGTKWPEGFNDLEWKDEKLRYWLRRERPVGIKGPRKQLIDVDWWMLRFYPINPKHPHTRHIERKFKEIADIVFKQSGEWRKQFDCCLLAERDDKFQAFKALIPGINRPKRGRSKADSLSTTSNQN